MLLVKKIYTYVCYVYPSVYLNIMLRIILYDILMYNIIRAYTYLLNGGVLIYVRVLYYMYILCIIYLH